MSVALHAYVTPFWARPADEVLRDLAVTRTGLSSAEAVRRLARWGPNETHVRAALSRARVLWRQLRSPLVLLLVVAAAASIASGESIDAVIVGLIVAASVGIGYVREYRAETAISTMLARIRITAHVMRDGVEQAIAVRELVPGDVFTLAAGSIVPADALLLEANELHVDDAVLTGESFPVVKRVGPVPGEATLRDRSNSVFFGTNIRSGTGRAVAVSTGASTEQTRMRSRCGSAGEPTSPRCST